MTTLPVLPSQLPLEAMEAQNRAWVTLITNAKYLPGLLTLDFALTSVKSKYPLVALYTDGLEPEGHRVLEQRGIAKRHTSELLPSVDDLDYGNDPRFRDTWSKLAVFGLEEYDKVGLLDSDMLVLQNFDEIMDIELDPPSLRGTGSRLFAAGHACSCNPMRKPHYPKDWVPASCAFTSQHADPDAAQEYGASTRLSHGMPNSGLVVTRPTRELYVQILDQLKNEEAVRSYVFPDQGVLVDLFGGRWVSLPYIYNGLKTMREPHVHQQIWRDSRVKIVHYIFSPKPWDLRRDDDMTELFKWWHKTNDERLKQEAQRGLISQ